MKKNKIDLALIGILLIIGLAFTGCPDDPAPGPGDTFVAVTGITGVPEAAVAGTPLNLTGTVAPTDATNKAITWSVANAGTTGATISGSTFNATATGTAIVTATIANGATATMPFTQDFTIMVIDPASFVAVTSITGMPTSAVFGTPLTLTGTVTPANATNKTITWSVTNAGTTGATINGSTFNATATGAAFVTATIANGAAQGTPFTRNFTIVVNPAGTFVAVEDITGIPEEVTSGTVVQLTSAVVVPANATNQAIVWSVQQMGNAQGSINGNALTITGAPGLGQVTLRATITNGATAITAYTQDFVIKVVAAFTAVTGITGVPQTVRVETDLTLTGTVQPATATNQTIEWSVKDAGDTGAVITGSTFTATTTGTATITATIADGKAEGEDYTEDFEITVLEAFVPVTGITGIPAVVIVETEQTLTATIEPENATNQTIVWSMKDAGTTGAAIEGNTLTTPTAGTVIITATIAEGIAEGANAQLYTQDFEINVVEAVGQSTIVYFWVNEQDEFASTGEGSTTLSIAAEDEVTISADSEGLSAHRWFVNGIEDTASTGAAEFAFTSFGKEAEKNYEVGVSVMKDGKPYYAAFTITVTE